MKEIKERKEECKGLEHEGNHFPGQSISMKMTEVSVIK
jgi:hypothetical protein